VLPLAFRARVEWIEGLEAIVDVENARSAVIALSFCDALK